MAKRKITYFELPPIIYEKPVKVSEQGNITQLTYMTFKSNGNSLQKISKTQYIDLNTGEVKEYQINENRKQNENGLYKTFKRLRAIINTNVTEPSNCKFITLTYAENMTDTDRLYTDLDKFNKRFKYYCKKENFGNPEYIAVIEPQARGAWHAHIIYIWNSRAPYIPYQKINELWGFGVTDVTALDDVDNVGAYLTAYLADAPIDETTASGEIKEVKGKKYIKGGRLHMYPSGMNIYRTSRGIKKPTEYYTVDQKIKKSAFGVQTFRNIIELELDNRKNYIVNEYYNSKRK